MFDGWTEADVPDLSGERVVVTGANSGIGYEATRIFAENGADVVMACRSEERGQRAAEELRDDGVSGDLHVEYCDLADLDTVWDFVDAVEERWEGLDVLCNNAGVMAVPRQETAQGHELQFGVNHLAHFALTAELLERLARADGESRIVTVSSSAHQGGEMDFEDLNWEEGYDRWDAYARSKLANVMFGLELDRRLSNVGIDGVRSVVCHPGFAATELQSKAAQARGSTVWRVVMDAATRVFAQSAAAGALPTVYAATHPDLEGGEYVGPGGFMNMRGTPTIQFPSDAAQDQDDAGRLWRRSVRMADATFDFGGLAAIAGE